MEALINARHPPRTPGPKSSGRSSGRIHTGEYGLSLGGPPTPRGLPFQRAEAERQRVPASSFQGVSLTRTARSSLPLRRPSPLPPPPPHPPCADKRARRLPILPAARAQPAFRSAEPQPASGRPCRRGHRPAGQRLRAGPRPQGLRLQPRAGGGSTPRQASARAAAAAGTLRR